MTRKILKLSDRNSDLITPRDILERTLEDIDDVEMVCVVIRVRDEKGLYTISGWSAGDAMMRLGMAVALQDDLLHRRDNPRGEES